MQLQVRLESNCYKMASLLFRFSRIKLVQLTIIAVTFLYGILLKTIVPNAILHGNNILFHNWSSAQIDDARQYLL